MPKFYADDHLVDEFGRVIPYTSFPGYFSKDTDAKDMKKILVENDDYRNNGSIVEGKRVKEFFDDTYGFYGETIEENQGRKLYVGDISATYNEDLGSGSIRTHIITDRNDIREKSRMITAPIDKEQYNQYMASTDDRRLQLASDWFQEIRLESTRSRTATVKDIRMSRASEGWQMTANIDGEDIRRNVSDTQASKMMILEGDKKEKIFSAVFDCKGVKATPGESTPLEKQIRNAVLDAEAVEAREKLSQIVGKVNTEVTPVVPDLQESNNAVVKDKSTPTPSVSKAADISNANFEQMSQDSKPEQTVSIHR